MRVAFVHDWLVSYRGGERVLEALLELYPNAPIFTLFYEPKALPLTLTSRDIRPVPALRPFVRFRKLLLPLLPAIIESLPLEGYDLVISTSSCVAKGVFVGPSARHLCYLHSPMRYVWDQREHYFGSLMKIPVLSQLVHLLGSRLRLWDTVSAARVDRFVCNSKFVADRAMRYYRREAEVVAPPVDWEQFKGAMRSPTRKGGYFLAAGALVPYKRFDLAILACRLAKKRLVIAGSGPDEGKLRAMAGEHVVFVIGAPAAEWASLMAGAEALLFPGIEDFGITAIEAMAAGTPVIALDGGGARDFVRPGETGTFFKDPEPAALAEVLADFDKAKFDGVALRLFAQSFSKEAFQTKMKAEIQRVLGQ